MDLFYYGGYFSEDSKKEEVLSRGVSVDYKKGYKGYSVKLDEKLRKGKKRWIKRRGVVVSITGRLKGVDRASHSSWGHYGVSPNTLSVGSLECSTALKTKWGVWNLKVGVR